MKSGGRGRRDLGDGMPACLPAAAADDVEAALATALAPFEMYSDDKHVDRGMWDRWTIRDASTEAEFAIAPGHWDDPRLIHDMPTRTARPGPARPGVCAGGLRGLLDFSRPSTAAERLHGASWDLWQELAATHPPAVPLAKLVHSL